MATYKSTLYKALQFCGRLWLLWFKAALCMSILSVLASVVKVAVSQDYDNDMYDVAFSMDEGLDESNMSNCSISIPDMNCTDLPADGRCLNCTFEFDCTYGANTTVTCVVPDEVECLVSHTQHTTCKHVQCAQEWGSLWSNVCVVELSSSCTHTHTNMHTLHTHTGMHTHAHVRTHTHTHTGEQNIRQNLWVSVLLSATERRGLLLLS